MSERSSKRKTKSKSSEHADTADSPQESSRTSSGRPWTLSIALPGSILANAQSHELRTYVVGQIARAAAVFQVDEIIIFRERIPHKGKCHDPDGLMAKLLEIQETPQYLRKFFFPFHRDFQHVGLLNPLGSPHHLLEDEWGEYREGVVLDRKPAGDPSASLVYVGIPQEVRVPQNLPPNVRVTVHLAPEPPACFVRAQEDPRKRHRKDVLEGLAVAPSGPREQSGLYWGYQTRLVPSLSAVWESCPFEGGYDRIVGTSERGVSIDSFELPAFRHLLLVFGGVHGLEHSIESDSKLPGSVEDVFETYLNVCPHQGSRTIRTEEAIPIALATLRPQILRAALTACAPAQTHVQRQGCIRSL